MTPKYEAIVRCVAAGYSTQTTILQELKRTYGITMAPNHFGIAIGRLVRAGQLVKTGDKKTAIWSLTAAGEQMTLAA